jgi:hypothetical protein
MWAMDVLWTGQVPTMCLTLKWPVNPDVANIGAVSLRCIYSSIFRAMLTILNRFKGRLIKTNLKAQ